MICWCYYTAQSLFCQYLTDYNYTFGRITKNYTFHLYNSHENPQGKSVVNLTVPDAVSYGNIVTFSVEIDSSPWYNDGKF